MKLLLIVSIILILSGCSSRSVVGYPSEYRQARAETTGVEPSEEAIARFIGLYGQLHGENLADRIAQVYAKELYFNDTLHSFKDRQSLINYLEKTARQVDLITVEVDHIIRDGENLFLSWNMYTEARALGRTMKADTIGMTHLRFNAQGQVILHQDYWDSTEGLFSHIPFIGGIVRWTRNQL
ncbi:MAG: nuclear transport factor 2 family protein [Gammaproteobacteria bacterium HGW-Gammaproteobacteria-14]|nr:MAG: nuclear transport factor 2 family protein [Gammaproteobacteria bacterium HGW-Gammaproteobacteria-14]